MIVNGNTLWFTKPIKNMVPKTRFNGVSHGLSEAGYDIRIKQDIFFSPTIIKDHWGGTIENGPMSFSINNGLPEISRFTIASAIEEFQMPNDLVGVVHDKSTWARQGLSVFNTVIEPGWNGFLTLELVYHGNEELHIPAGSGIAQVLFSEISNPTKYAGKYQNQEDKPVEAKFE